MYASASATASQLSEPSPLSRSLHTDAIAVVKSLRLPWYICALSSSMSACRAAPTHRTAPKSGRCSSVHATPRRLETRIACDSSDASPWWGERSK